MADPAFASEFREGDFGDQIRPDPLRAARVGTRHIGRRGLPGAAGKLRGEVLHRCRIEAGPNLALVNQVFRFPLGEQQG